MSFKHLLQSESLRLYKIHWTAWEMRKRLSVSILRPGMSPFWCSSPQTGHQWCSSLRSLCLCVERHVVSVRFNTRRSWEQAKSDLSNMADVFWVSSRKIGGKWKKMSICILWPVSCSETALTGSDMRCWGFGFVIFTLEVLESIYLEAV